MEAIRQSPSYSLVGWRILDRWAMNTPEKLLDLESLGEVILLGKLLTQQQLEQEALSRSTGPEFHGLMPHEILAMNEIMTEL
jgi:hypothetical protein